MDRRDFLNPAAAALSASWARTTPPAATLEAPPIGSPGVPSRSLPRWRSGLRTFRPKCGCRFRSMAIPTVSVRRTPAGPATHRRPASIAIRATARRHSLPSGMIARAHRNCRSPIGSRRAIGASTLAGPAPHRRCRATRSISTCNRRRIYRPTASSASTASKILPIASGTALRSGPAQSTSGLSSTPTATRRCIGCGTGDIKFMLESGNLGGKCADLNALFVGLARSVGIPARDVYGVRVADSATLEEPRQERRHHQGAALPRRSSTMRGFGWVPVNPADVRKVVLEEEKDKLLPLDDPRVNLAREDALRRLGDELARLQHGGRHPPRSAIRPRRWGTSCIRMPKAPRDRSTTTIRRISSTG